MRLIRSGPLRLVVLEPTDYALLRTCYLENKDHLVPWEPARDESYYAACIGSKPATCPATYGARASLSAAASSGRDSPAYLKIAGRWEDHVLTALVNSPRWPGPPDRSRWCRSRLWPAARQP